MKKAFMHIHSLAIAVGAICFIMSILGCGTSSSYSIHTVPNDITGTWVGTATRNFTEYDLTLSFVQTGDVTVVVYSFDDETGTITGTYSSGNLDAGTDELKFNLLFLMTTATGTLTIGENEYQVKVTKQTE